MRRSLLFAIVIMVVVATARESQAAGRRRFLWGSPPSTYRAAPSYSETYQYLNQRYPKYYGGFHASYFENMGVPTGDLGPRGNGIYRTPW